MVRRWSEVEENALRVVRERLADQIREAPQFPEVVGDRRIIRFYCGTPKRHDLEECVSMYSKFLKWRKERGVDRIREDIVYGGKNSPLLFPHGEKIIRMAPQIVLTANATDKLEHPVALELFEFSPSEVFKQVTIDQYLEFLIYCLEYRTLVLEQISEMKERKYLQEHPNEEDREEGYGVIQRILHIRDLKGIGLAHISADGRALVTAALNLGLPNYPEILAKAVFVNTPFIFNTLWFFVKAMLDEFTLSKICFYGSDFMEALQKDIDMASIPAMLGGTYREFNEPFVFDVTEGGALYHAGGSEILITPRIGTEDTQQDVSKDSETVTNRL